MRVVPGRGEMTGPRVPFEKSYSFFTSERHHAAGLELRLERQRGTDKGRPDILEYRTSGARSRSFGHETVWLPT